MHCIHAESISIGTHSHRATLKAFQVSNGHGDTSVTTDFCQDTDGIHRNSEKNISANEKESQESVISQEYRHCFFFIL